MVITTQDVYEAVANAFPKMQLPPIAGMTSDEIAPFELIAEKLSLIADSDNVISMIKQDAYDEGYERGLECQTDSLREIRDEAAASKEAAARMLADSLKIQAKNLDREVEKLEAVL